MSPAERPNEEWLHQLRLPEPQCNAVIQELSRSLLRGLNATFRRRYRVSRVELEDLVQEALIKILGALDTFRGESRFTTWAMKIAVRLTLTELRRLRWKDVSLDALQESGFQAPEMTGRGVRRRRQCAPRSFAGSWTR